MWYSMYLFTLLLGCTSAPPTEGSTLTDGGTWTVGLEETSFDQGDNDVALVVADADGAPAPGLDVLAQAEMEGMSHGHEDAPCEDQGDGRYVCALTFEMSGLWNLAGSVSDGQVTEGFELVIEVRP